MSIYLFFSRGNLQVPCTSPAMPSWLSRSVAKIQDPGRKGQATLKALETHNACCLPKVFIGRSLPYPMWLLPQALTLQLRLVSTFAIWNDTATH